MSDLPDYFIPALFSVFFILVYIGIFRLIGRQPRLIEIMIGLSLVSAAAVILESYLFTALGTLLGLLVVAPVLEEILKFSATFRKRDAGAGIGVGLGFALTENVLYFHSFISGIQLSSILSISFISSQIFIFILMRGAFDPLLHSTLSGLSVRTWQKGKRFWLPVAIGLHATYNLAAIIGQTDISFLIAADVIILSPALYLLLRKGKTNVQTASPEVSAEPKPQHTKARHPIYVPIEKLGLDNLAAWVRSTSRNSGFENMARMIGLDIQNRYQRTSWIRRSVLQSGTRKTTYTEIGIYGAFLIAGLTALGGIVVWVLFL